MTCLDFFLRLEGPEINFSAADNDVMGHNVVMKGCKNGFWSIRESISDYLKTMVICCVPNPDDFVCTQTDKVEPFFIDI